MNKLFELFTTEARAKFLAAISTDEFTSFIEQTKSATDSGTFRVVISTPAVDRQGDSVDQNLWDLSNYLNNPVVLWAHDYSSLPIGVCTGIQKQNVGGQPVLIAEGKFAPTEFAQQVRKLYEADIVRATSVGFIPATARMDGKSEQGNELLEFSFVPVPANPQALSLSQAQKLGLNIALLTTKGIVFVKAEPPDEGDACTLEDGSEGILEENGNDELVCVPKPKSDKTKNPPNLENSAGDPRESTKAGRTLSKPTREKIQNAIDALKAGTVALEALLTAADSQGGEGEDNSGDGGAPKQRSIPVGSSDVFNFDDWKFSREVLRAIVTSGGEALERFNIAAREQSQRK